MVPKGVSEPCDSLLHALCLFSLPLFHHVSYLHLEMFSLSFIKLARVEVVFVLFDFYDGAHSSAFLMNQKSSAVNPSSTWSMAWTLITYKGRAVTVRPSGVLELPAGFRLLPKGSGTSVPSVFFSVWVRMSLSQVPYLCWKVNTSLEMHKITWANHLKYS